MEQRELSFEETREKALRLLEFRSHSERELALKLKRAGARAEYIEAVLEYLRQYGLVDDAAYAKRAAADLKNLKKFGKRRIRAELKNRGIASELAEEALAELEDEEAEALLPLVEKKLAGNFARKNVEKCIRYFAYRGYGYDDIKACIEQIKGEEAWDIT